MNKHHFSHNIILWSRYACIFMLTFFLTACEVELYQDLDEKQANTILAALLESNIAAKKENMGKAGYAILVEEENLIRALDLLNKRNLPEEHFQSLGTVFTNDNLVSSSQAEQARMAFAISQELSNTFSKIDGVITSRVHVVLGEVDQANKPIVDPSAAIFIRHLPNSMITNYTNELRSITSKTVPKINEKNISVVLIPVRESISVPWTSPPTFLQTFIQGSKDSPLLIIMLGIISIAGFIYIIRMTWLFLGFLRERNNKPNS